MGILLEGMLNVDTRVREHSEWIGRSGGMTTEEQFAEQVGVDRDELVRVLTNIEDNALVAFIRGEGSPRQIVRGIFTQGIALGLEIARLREEQ